MGKRVQVYTAAEKYKIALEAIKGNLTQAEITAKYKIHSTQINNWKKQALEYLQAAFANKLQVNNVINDYETQLAGLYQQIGQLKVENDFLKKKLELFNK
jgi:transposase-like protein